MFLWLRSCHCHWGLVIISFSNYQCFLQVYDYICLTLSWRRSPSCRNQSTDLQSKSMDWFLCHTDLHHERVKRLFSMRAWVGRFLLKNFPIFPSLDRSLLTSFLSDHIWLHTETFLKLLVFTTKIQQNFWNVMTES